jgi:uncharacterized protein YndB with AHSA1/START domain
MTMAGAIPRVRTSHRSGWMKRDIHFEVTYPHPRERVWRALTDPELLADWLMPNDFQPEVGHTFQFRSDPAPGWDGIVHCKVLELEAPHRLAMSWKGGMIDTVVTFTLEEVAEGTKLRLDHTGFKGLRSVVVSLMMSGGWKSKMLRERLPEVLERLADSHPGS